MGTGTRISDKYEAFCNHLRNQGFHYLGEGSFRKTFYRKNIVIKVPINTDGFNDNIIEAKAWRKYRNQPTNLGMFLAPCRLLPNGCLMMPLVDKKLSESDEDVDWVQLIDGAQAGYHKGKLVAYDYALDLKERAAWEKELERESEWFHENWVTNRDYLLEE